MKIGIFGGTFNPPHLGHLRLVCAFADRFSLERVWIIPTFEPPHKSTAELADGATRMEMCRLLFDDPRFEVSDIELRRGGKSYTVETLRALHAQFPNDRLFFLVGSDMLRSFETWYLPDEIRRLCTLCAAVRHAGETLPNIQAEVLEDFDPIDVSSTEVRRRVRMGDRVEEYLGAALADYVTKKNLYADRYTSYCRLLRQKLGAYRLRHSFAVADSAKQLAEQYGGDADKAYLAGLLHDIMKDTPKDEMLRFLCGAGVELTNAELHNPKLWHAMAGEAYLRTVLHMDDQDLLNAVRYHTTGSAGMSLLEKVLYVADYISADRDYTDVDKMRAFTSQSLERAMRFGLSFTIADLAQKEQIIHPDSVDCYNMICMETRKEEP